MKLKNSFLRTIAFIVAITFLCETCYAKPLPTIPSSPEVNSLIEVNSKNFSIPKNLGFVSEYNWKGEDSPIVVLIQDAHAVIEGQRKTQELLAFLKKEYGFDLVGLEGASGVLDPTYLRAFPDKLVLEKVLGEYLAKGELSGGEMAALLNPTQATYVGVEDWKLYIENYNLYRQALAVQPKAIQWLTSYFEELNRKKKDIFTEEQSSFYSLLESFEGEQIMLDEFLKRARKYSIFESLSEEFPLINRLLQIMDQDSSKGGFPMSKIKAEHLVKELDRWSSSIAEGLFRSEQSKRLYQDFRQLRLLFKLVNLKINRDELNQLVSSERIAPYQLIKPALEFYQKAQERDAVLLQNLLEASNELRLKKSVLVVGGFHTKGIVKRLARHDLSYVVLTPAIGSFEGGELYEERMEGEFSYVQGPSRVQSQSFYNSFHYHATRDILKKVKDPQGAFKKWRDEIIYQLAREDRLHHSSYYLDMLLLFLNDSEEVNSEYLDEVSRQLIAFRNLNLDAIWKRFVSQNNSYSHKLMPQNSNLSIIRTVLRSEVLNPSPINEAFLFEAPSQNTGVNISVKSAKLEVDVSYVRSESRTAALEVPPYEMDWTKVPPIETENYTDLLTLEKSREIEGIVSSQARRVPDITSLDLEGEQITVRILVGDRLRAKRFEVDRLSEILEKSYLALKQDEKNYFKQLMSETATKEPLSFGLIPHERGKWQAAKQVTYVESLSFIGLNDYLFEISLEDSILSTLVFNSLLQPFRTQEKEPSSDFERAQAFYEHPSIGGKGNLYEDVRIWQRKVGQRRYHFYQETADLFIESNRERYGFISEESSDFPIAYRVVKRLVDRLLLAEGFDSESFNFHFADYKESNAFVIQYSNHIVLNMGLINHFMTMIMNYEASSSLFKEFFGKLFIGEAKRLDQKIEKLENFYQEHIAQILAHEISHLKQHHDQVHEGRQEKPETIKEMHERMRKSRMQIMIDEGMDKRDVYVNEIDADRYSLELMDKAGMSIKEAHMFFQLAYLEMRDKGGTETIFGDHPLLVERVKNIRREVKNKYYENYDAPMTPFLEEGHTIDSSPFYQEIMKRYDESKKIRMKRAHKKEFAHQVMLMRSEEDYLELINKVKDIDDFKFLVTVGQLALILKAAEMHKDPAVSKKIDLLGQKVAKFMQKNRKLGKRLILAGEWEFPEEAKGDGLFYASLGHQDDPRIHNVYPRPNVETRESRRMRRKRSRSVPGNILESIDPSFFQFWMGSILVPGTFQMYMSYRLAGDIEAELDYLDDIELSQDDFWDEREDFLQYAIESDGGKEKKQATYEGQVWIQEAA